MGHPHQVHPVVARRKLQRKVTLRIRLRARRLLHPLRQTNQHNIIPARGFVRRLIRNDAGNRISKRKAGKGRHHRSSQNNTSEVRRERSHTLSLRQTKGLHFHLAKLSPVGSRQSLPCLRPCFSAQNAPVPQARQSLQSPWLPRPPAPSAVPGNPAPGTSQPDTQSSDHADCRRSHPCAPADNQPPPYPPAQMDFSPARTYTTTRQTSVRHLPSSPYQYSVSRRIRSRSASPPKSGPAAITGSC